MNYFISYYIISFWIGGFSLITVFMSRNTSYYGEIQACIIDAVHCGIQMAIKGKINIEDGNVIKGDSNNKDMSE